MGEMLADEVKKVNERYPRFELKIKHDYISHLAGKI